MSGPPETLDGARVIAFALAGPESSTGATKHYVGNDILSEPAGLALAAYDGSEEVYLFYCDSDWNVTTDTLHSSKEEAIDQARFEFGEVAFTDVTSA